MSRLLINEAPLQVLPTLAAAIGLNEAIFLQQLHYRLSSGRMHDGRRWFTRTVKDWRATDFPFWSPKTIQRTADSLRDLGLIDATDRFNASDDRSLWYAINYDRLDDIELGLNEKPAPSAVGHFDQSPKAISEKPAPSAVGHFDQAPEISGGGLGHFDQLSPYKKLKPPTPPTPSQEHLTILAEGGVGDEFQFWAEHLKLEGGPALSLTLSQWVGWVQGGLTAELREAATAVILMGGTAASPAAVLKARMERQGQLRLQNVARAAVAAADAELLNQGATEIAEGDRFNAPTGRTLTAEYAADGYVFWVEDAPEAPIAAVLRWPRATAGSVA